MFCSNSISPCKMCMNFEKDPIIMVKFYILVCLFSDTVNVEIFAQYIFSHISHRALGSQTFDVSKNYNHKRTNRIKWYERENLAARKYLRLQYLIHAYWGILCWSTPQHTPPLDGGALDGGVS